MDAALPSGSLSLPSDIAAAAPPLVVAEPEAPFVEAPFPPPSALEDVMVAAVGLPRGRRRLPGTLLGYSGEEPLPVPAPPRCLRHSSSPIPRPTTAAAVPTATPTTAPGLSPDTLVDGVDEGEHREMAAGRWASLQHCRAVQEQVHGEAWGAGDPDADGGASGEAAAEGDAAGVVDGKALDSEGEGLGWGAAGLLVGEASGAPEGDGATAAGDPLGMTLAAGAAADLEALREGLAGRGEGVGGSPTTTFSCMSNRMSVDFREDWWTWRGLAWGAQPGHGVRCLVTCTCAGAVLRVCASVHHVGRGSGGGERGDECGGRG
jgi:hypothetical protein